MLIRIAVADTDDVYLERLRDVLGDYSDLRLSVYSDADILSDALASGRIDVLLIDPSIYTGRLPIERTAVVIILAGDSRIPSGCEEYPAIRKYQRISMIHQQILEICSDKLELSSSAPGSKNAVISAFYSPAGGCGKTTAALIAATRLAINGYKTFYLNLESFPSDGCYLPQDSQNSLSTLLERLGQKREQVMMYLRGSLLTKSDNFFYLKHFDSPNDYAAMSPEELDNLIDILRKSGSFDCIVVDTQSGFDEKVKLIFDRADRVVLVEKPDMISEIKLTAFLSQSYITEEYGIKFNRLLNFYNGRPSGLDTSIQEIGRISAVGGADSGSLVAGKAKSSESDFALTLVGR